jgi:arylsulfatase A-like enzyme
MTRKNVLMIVVDQWRADFVPHLMRARGETPFLKTPNLDRLCEEGVTFPNHVTVTLPCGPARASLMTGLYMMNHRAVQNTVPLDQRHFNLAKALREIGYDPALIGYTTTAPDPRSTHPNDPRFLQLGDLMEGFRSVGAFEPSMDGYFGWVAQKGFPLPPQREDIWLPEGVDAVPGATDRPARIPQELSDTSYFTERALSYLKGKNGKPFFLHLGYYRPHPPFVAPAPYHAMYRPEDMPGPVRAADWRQEAAQHPLLDFYLRSTNQGSFFQGAQGKAHALSDAEIRQMRATYCGLITEIDDALGKVFAYLDETGQWDDTLIVFTSDHAEQLGDHSLLGKVSYFDESYRIPLVVKDPQRKQSGGRIETAFTESVDVMPTIIDWLGGKPPRACDGRSILPLVAGEIPADWRTELHYEFDFRDIFYSEAETATGVSMDQASLCVVQDAHYKYVHFAALPPLFFDLTADPDQFVNLANDPAYASLILTYAQKALSWRLTHAERTLTHYRSSSSGLQIREDGGPAKTLRDIA